MSDLPPSWTVASLGDLLAELRNGVFVSRPGTDDTGRPILRISAVRPMTLRDNDVRYVPATTVVENEANSRLDEGDLLFTRYSGNPEYVGACARVRRRVPNLLYPDKLIRGRVIPDLVDPGYLEAVMSAPQTRAVIRRLVKTTAGQVGISGSDLRSVPVPLAPYPEQLWIVAAIEEQFSRLDAGVAALERARQNLRRIRAAVFQGAVNGTLTETDLSVWRTHRLADVAIIASGQTPRALELAESGPIPFYKVGDMNAAAGQFMADSRGYVDMPTAMRFGLHIRPAGTVIFPKRGGAIATNKKRILREPSAYDLNTMGLVPGADIDSRFLYLWISSIDLNRLADGSNVPQINHGDLADLELRVPPPKEQERIVALADAALSLVDGLEAALSHAEIRSSRLRSSILAAAFSGNLVPQDRTDESASVLLQRITGEHAVSNGHRPKRGRKPRVLQEEVTE